MLGGVKGCKSSNIKVSRNTIALGKITADFTIPALLDWKHSYELVRD